ncbi:hypothetical protein [Spiroplasma sp. SV19]|uniref:hypothetical protein n=1 Tax=Spiroplasma sp. SV19 TaxID=2570468 RepID=UPI0024B74A3A|nr:hypothetical protein [Spiroplasma sp. SV19]
MAKNITDLYILTSEIHSKIYDKNNQNKLLGYFINIPNTDNKVFYVQKSWVYNDEAFINCFKVGISQNLYPVFNKDDLTTMVDYINGSEIIAAFISKLNKKTNNSHQELTTINNDEDIDIQKLLEDLKHIDEPDCWKDGVYLGTNQGTSFSK